MNNQVEVNKSEVKKVGITLQKMLDSQTKLIAKKEDKGLTPYELARLANIEFKLSLRTPSQVYKYLKNSDEALSVLGKADVPTFKEFIDKAKAGDKEYIFSYWQGLKIFASFNKSEQQKVRASNQQAKENKK